ncbi:uncharacterized protein I303_100431 [Kwoniella dejecticola CBS 10117]|uniref:Uncharacterized protein n=1 Tax=Kwoniella dejecticola CBS 10117 TaxID=1296121 RepID=A0A1A6AF11_9TREE|nr:uncharacterized protein I303_00430 [Kwoniella dejecticola CBS 10117]OBR88613.1 hypothetical protein I303_00430 [Kwoniella dejecticola CBS 10117]
MSHHASESPSPSPDSGLKPCKAIIERTMGEKSHVISTKVDTRNTATRSTNAAWWAFNFLLEHSRIESDRRIKHTVPGIQKRRKDEL